MKKLLLTLVSVVFVATVGSAAVVDVPFTDKGNGIVWKNNQDSILKGITAGFVYDGIYDRDIKDYDAQASADIFGGKLGTVISNATIYTILGQASNIKLDETIGTNDLTYKMGDAFSWAAGLNGQIYENSGFVVFGDAKYRKTSSIEINSLELNGTTYTKEQLGASSDFNWQEWQVALGIGKEFKYVTPYAGVKYSDIKIDGSVTVGSYSESATLKSDNNVGPFVGLAVNLFDGLSINLQGRFVDEQAFSAEVCLKF